MILTERDKTLIEKLHGYAVMTTRQVAKAVFKNIQLKTVLRRLRKLEQAQLIRRNVGLTTYEHSWTLTEKGAKLISDRPPKWHQSRFLLEHDTKLTAVRLALEEAGVARSWVPEHTIRAKVAANHGVDSTKYRLIPDGIMGIEAGGLKESVAVEVELHCKNSKRYLDNFYDYKKKTNILGVWYLTSSSSLGHTIEKLWRKSGSANRKPYFFWSVIDDVIERPAQALIHSNGESNLLIKAWTPPTTDSPAHTPADPVGKQTNEPVENETALTA